MVTSRALHTPTGLILLWLFCALQLCFGLSRSSSSFLTTSTSTCTSTLIHITSTTPPPPPPPPPPLPPPPPAPPPPPPPKHYTVNQSNPEARQDQQCSIACRGGPGEYDAELHHGFFLRQHGFLGHSFRARAWGLGFRASGGAVFSIRAWSACGTSACCW